MSVSVSILNLSPPWNESTLNIISCLGKQYVAKSTLARTLISIQWFMQWKDGSWVIYWLT
jgi:hypothetical protein